MDRFFKMFADKSIPIPITQRMLQYLFDKQTYEGIKHVEIKIDQNCLIVSGIAKKMLFAVEFTIFLEPVNAVGRKIGFKIKEIKPVNFEWVNEKVFNKMQSITYKNGYMTIDLNEIDKIKAVPFGTIKKFEIKGNILWCSIGL